MNKAQLVAAMSQQADLPKAHAERALEALIDTVTQELKQGGSVTLVGFGQFSSKVTKPRTGRNPQTGETIQIAASIRPAFKPGKVFKDAIQ